MRTTRKEVDSLFGQLCMALGKQVHKTGSPAGAWGLDYNECYGGYVIYELLQHGAQSHPYGHHRRSAKDIAYTIRFALRSIQLDRNPVNTGAYYPDAKTTALGERDQANQ